MTKVLCDSTDCMHNEEGICTRERLYISDAETGEAACTDAYYEKEEQPA